MSLIEIVIQVGVWACGLYLIAGWIFRFSFWLGFKIDKKEHAAARVHQTGIKK